MPGYIRPTTSIVNFRFGRPNYIAPANPLVDFPLDENPSHPGYSEIPSAIASVSSPWDPAPGDSDRQVEFPHGRGQERNQIAVGGAANASSLDVDSTARHANSPSIEIKKRAPWSRPGMVDVKDTARYLESLKRDARARSSWEEAAVRYAHDFAARFNAKPAWKDIEREAPFRSTALYTATRKQTIQPSAGYQVGRADFSFLLVRSVELQDRYQFAPLVDRQGSQTTDRRFSAPFVAKPGIIEPPTAIPWGPSGSRDTTIDLPYDDIIDPVWPIGPGITPEAPQQETYSTVNYVNVIRVSDGEPIEMQNVTISLDVDSWAWTLSAEVVGAGSLQAIEPTADGLVDVEITINGHVWVFMIESYTDSRAHANQRYQVSGVSRTQLLAAPYAPKRSRVYTSEILASQVVDDELLNTGFTISWETAQWVISAGALSYQGLSPLAVAKRVADAAGAILIPSKAGDSLTVKPRFRISPWALTGTPFGDLDAQIAMEMVSGHAMQFEAAELFDSAYISGTNQGVATLVERAGHAGNAPAPETYDDLATDTDMTTERARQIIAGSGNRGIYTETLPLTDNLTPPGLIEPGMVVEVIEGEKAWRGYVLGVQISAPRVGSEKIQQSVQIVRMFEHE